MNAHDVFVFFVWCITVSHVRTKPQLHEATTRSLISNSNRPLLTNVGERFFGITVVNNNGHLRPSYTSTDIGDNGDKVKSHRLPVPTADRLTVSNECLSLERCKRSSDIVFPDALNRTMGCGHTDTTFCEDVDDYPTMLVEDQLLRNGSSFSAFFGEDKFPDVLTQRFNGNGIPDDVELCQSEKSVIYPRKGVTIDNDWKFIVNQNDGRQGVLIELCKSQTNEENQCAFSNSFPSGYKAYCKQHFVYRQMVSFTESGAPFEKDYFKMPSCCKCVLRQV